MKKFLLSLLVFGCFLAKAQVYNNEWIDYSKTYYKFKVGSTGLFRIPQSVLSTAGLAATPAEYFQLWRNGVQIPLYTSIAAGAFSNSDYIEFWGEMNDGRPDKELYRDPNYQLNAKWNLVSDTAAYFLTVNPVVVNNLRLQNASNNIAGNTLTAEPYFMYKLGKYYIDQINTGNAVNVGDYMYSSSYDKGEGFSSVNIGLSASLSFTFPDQLAVYTSGPSPSFKIAVAGNAINARRYKATINSDSVVGNEVDYFNYSVDTATFNLTTLASNTATVSVTNLTQCTTPPDCPAFDAMVVAQYEITYPRKFDFGGKTNFEFILPVSASGNYLKINNFSYGSVPPVLYDLTNGNRYVADMSLAPVLQFVLQPSATDRRLVLVSEDPTGVNMISSVLTRNFINYTAPGNQGDYLIISNPILYNGTNGSNPIDDYKQYRSSLAGGSYNAKVYDINEIVDQFGFGINKNPASVRDFLLYARNKYVNKPRHVFIIGKGVTYVSQRYYEQQHEGRYDLQNLVPTFGYPASDILLSADPGTSNPQIPIGRLSAIYPQEVEAYLKKIKDFELAQATLSPSVEDKKWMKNVVHIEGSSDGLLQNLLDQYLNNYKQIIIDTLFGARVSTYSKNSTDAVSQIDNSSLPSLFAEGISLITYFGHSSASTLEFNLDNPNNYNNYGKYPVFIGLGCNVGNFYNFNPLRFQTKETLSEIYVLAPDHGAIGFVASTHFGIVHYLDIWNSRAYNEITNKSYGKTIGEIIKATAEDVFSFTSQEDFYARCNIEETQLHGDPAIRLNPHTKPDYVIEDPMILVNPSFVTVADHSFKVSAKIMNIGRAVDKKIVIEIKRKLPNNSVVLILRDTIPGIRYMDSVSVNIPIDPLHDKGLNQIIVTADAGNAVDEIFETNNSITKDVMIYEDEANPIYPYNYSIINKQNIKFIASTANPFSPVKQYQMELDTTALFNSSWKKATSVSTAGGVMEFSIPVTFTDSTVYYWRVAPVVTSGNPSWNYASFVYLANSDVGFNQSHFFQHLQSGNLNLSLDSNSRKWKFGTITQNLFLKLGTWITSGANQDASLSVAINSVARIRAVCWFSSLQFNVIDPVTFQPWFNQTIVPGYSAPNNMGEGLYQSLDYNPPFALEPRYHDFEYRYTDTAGRRKMMDFMKNVIPDGSYVIVRNFTLDSVYAGPTFPVAYAADWAADTAFYGPGKSLYHYLKNAGLEGIDSFYRIRPWGLVYKKNDPSFKPRWIMGEGKYDNPTLSVDCPTPDTLGYITSPQFGPAKQWKELRWAGASQELIPGDNPTIDIIGITANGIIDTVMKGLALSQPVVDISSISAQQYPYLELHMRNIDSLNFTPYQLRYWRLTNVPAPEGAVAPNIYFQMKDTVEVAEPLEFKLAFKNVSEVDFDSLKVKIIVTDKNNVKHVLPTFKVRALPGNDTLNVHYPLDTRQLAGNNILYVEVNPDNDQPEQYHFNNFIYRNFYVRPDTLNPFMDVTFDNVHILNHDIVSAKPDIVINLKDEAKWFLLNDKSVMHVQVRFPDQSLHPYNFDNDTLLFVPAQQTQDPKKGMNTATAVFKPYFTQDGEYQLIVSGQDMSENKAGSMEYKVSFNVINKPMISNMLNYPNPFTTSTAFVFTITGSEVPQNIKIQILTVTGKVVREITKDELGPLHIGRNITEFKWDGTDQYGQKLGNGVYLYHVVTNLNRKSLDKYTSDSDNTDKYFIKGYGKMYLMR